MNVNWLIFSYRLVVLYGFYVTVQGVGYPLTMDEVAFEIDPGNLISYDKSSFIHIIITRNEYDNNWFNVWTLSAPDLSLSLQLEQKTHDYRFTFRIKDIYSFVMNTFAGECYGVTNNSSPYIRMVIKSRNDARSFHYEEIHSKKKVANLDMLRNMSTTSSGLFVGVTFHHQLSHVLIYTEGEVKILMRNAILDSFLMEDRHGVYIRQFLIHPWNDNDLRYTDILFTAHFVNTVTSTVPNRAVLGIWIEDKVVFNICLIFTNVVTDEIDQFYEKMSSFVNSDLVIDENQATLLYNANPEYIEDVPIS